jgi:hypothetical protein
MDAHTRRNPDGYFLTSVDPGGDTGMSLFHIKPDSFRLLEYATVQWRPRDGFNPVDTLVGWRLEYPGVHHLLYEEFNVRNTENAAAADTTSLRVIGAIEQMMYERGNIYEAVFDQIPTKAKYMGTDEILEKLNLHLDNAHAQRHVRDANRHAVVHLAKRGYLPVCEVAYPRRGRRPPAMSHPVR